MRKKIEKPPQGNREKHYYDSVSWQIEQPAGGNSSAGPWWIQRHTPSRHVGISQIKTLSGNKAPSWQKTRSFSSDVAPEIWQLLKWFAFMEIRRSSHSCYLVTVNLLRHCCRRPGFMIANSSRAARTLHCRGDGRHNGNANDYQTISLSLSGGCPTFPCRHAG